MLLFEPPGGRLSPPNGYPVHIALDILCAAEKSIALLNLTHRYMALWLRARAPRYQIYSQAVK